MYSKDQQALEDTALKSQCVKRYENLSALG